MGEWVNDFYLVLHGFIMMEKNKNTRNKDNEVNEPAVVYQPEGPLTFEKVWQMFQETDKKFRETDKKFKETDRKFQDTDRKFQDTDRKFQDTDRKFQDTDRKFQDTERIMKEQSKETLQSIRELKEEYKDRWGELVESLVSGNLLRILKARNFLVHKVSPRVRNYKGEPNYELDLVASNGDEVVVVEVKSSLNVEAVKHFISQLQLVRNHSRRFRKQRMIGAVAYLKDHCDAARMAMNRGLLVIRATGESAAILNDEDFKPIRF